MIRGKEFHPIIERMFGDVKGYLESEQIQVNCPKCQQREGLSIPDGRYNLEINTAKRLFRCWKCDVPKFSGGLKRLIRTYGSKFDYDIYIERLVSCIMIDTLCLTSLVIGLQIKKGRHFPMTASIVFK